jgi:hypothetical protein
MSLRRQELATLRPTEFTSEVFPNNEVVGIISNKRMIYIANIPAFSKS